MKVELLISTPFDESFCCDKDSFINFLQVEKSIILKESKLIFTEYNNKLELDYSVEVGITPDNNERYFFLKIETLNEIIFLSSEFYLFESLVEKISGVSAKIHPLKTKVNTIWNDIGIIYATNAYPVINNIENLMRKLISKFMLINVGVNWIDLRLEKDVITTKITKFDDEKYINDLYKIDFIQLSNILFNKKRDLTLEEVDRMLGDEKNINLDIDKLKRFIPKSNWELYFSEIVKEKDTDLKKKWEILYGLRNMVAHNRFMLRKNYEECLGISNQIKNILNNAIENLDNINLNKVQINKLRNEVNPEQKINEFVSSLVINQLIYRDRAINKKIGLYKFFDINTIGLCFSFVIKLDHDFIGWIENLVSGVQNSEINTLVCVLITNMNTLKESSHEDIILFNNSVKFCVENFINPVKIDFRILTFENDVFELENKMYDLKLDYLVN